MLQISGGRSAGRLRRCYVQFARYSCLPTSSGWTWIHSAVRSIKHKTVVQIVSWYKRERDYHSGMEGKPWFSIVALQKTVLLFVRWNTHPWSSARGNACRTDFITVISKSREIDVGLKSGHIVLISPNSPSYVSWRLLGSRAYITGNTYSARLVRIINTWLNSGAARVNVPSMKTRSISWTQLRWLFRPKIITRLRTACPLSPSRNKFLDVGWRMIEFVLVWYNEICRCWQGCFILSPCTLKYAWHLSLNGLTSESDGLIVNLRPQIHCIHCSTFHVCFTFGNFHTGCVASVGMVTESVYNDVVYIRMDPAPTTAYHTSPEFIRAISWKSVKSKHESIICELLLASGSFCALHDSNPANWLEDVLFRLIYRGTQHQKELKGSWYNTCSIHISPAIA